MVVLSFDLNEGNLSTEKLQGRKHLEALDKWNVGISIAMEQ
jgi:hypothetical protein